MARIDLADATLEWLEDVQREHLSFESTRERARRDEGFRRRVFLALNLGGYWDDISISDSRVVITQGSLESDELASFTEAEIVLGDRVIVLSAMRADLRHELGCDEPSPVIEIEFS